MSLPLKNTVHLYRDLLREAGYLFDKAAKDFHAHHIQWSFRRQLSRKRSSQHEIGPSDAPPLPSQHLTQQLRRGRKYLYLLRRANQGYAGAIENVLKTTYARKGKRRREILNEIMIPDIARGTTSESPHPDARLYTESFRPPSRFGMILKGQGTLQSHLDSRGKIKPVPQIPATNRWNKAFPKSRIKKIMNNWYARHADLLLPPLSEKEWLGVHQRATAQPENATTMISRRRPLGTDGVLTTPVDAIGLLREVNNIVRSSARVVEHGYSRRIRGVIGNPHNLTPRFLRRITIRTVLQNTPTAVANPETGKLALRWESGIAARGKPRTPSNSEKMCFFDG